MSDIVLVGLITGSAALLGAFFSLLATMQSGRRQHRTETLKLAAQRQVALDERLFHARAAAYSDFLVKQAAWRKYQRADTAEALIDSAIHAKLFASDETNDYFSDFLSLFLSGRTDDPLYTETIAGLNISLRKELTQFHARYDDYTYKNSNKKGD